MRPPDAGAARAAGRRIALDGCLNFRDLGGYPTRDGRRIRWGQVFRSDALQLLSAGDIARLRDELRIGAVIDLRSTAEIEAEGRGLLEREPIDFHHIPLFDGEVRDGRARAADMDLTERYFLLAQFARERIGQVLRTLADASGPAVYHCAAGKDRTGVISAIILGVLGVDEEVIVADYALTGDVVEGIIERLMAATGYQTMLEALPPDTLHAHPETMARFLDRLRQTHGSLQQYANAAGVGDDLLARLQERLLE